MEKLKKLIESDLSPEEKLRSLLKNLIYTARQADHLWGVKLRLRELLFPHP